MAMERYCESGTSCEDGICKVNREFIENRQKKMQCSTDVDLQLAKRAQLMESV